MKISIDLTNEDIKKAHKFFIFKTKKGKKQIRFWTLFNVGFAIVLNFFHWFTDDKLTVLIPVYIITAIVQMIIFQIFFYLIIWIRIKTVNPGKTKGILGKHSVEIDSKGFREATEYNDSLQRWSAVDDILDNKEAYFFIYNHSILTVPKRSFTTTQEAEEFYNTAIQYWKGN